MTLETALSIAATNLAAADENARTEIIESDRQYKASLKASEIPCSEIDINDDRPTAYWVSADRQSSLDMRGTTLAEALAELTRDSVDEYCRAEALAGFMAIDSATEPTEW